MKNQENMTKNFISIKRISKILTFFICLGFFISLANLLSTFVVYASLNKYSVTITQNSNTLYFLSISKSKVKNEIDLISQDFQKQTYGAYTYKNDDYYHLIASVYENQNDAILVQSNLNSNGFSCEIIKVNFPSISINGDFSNNEKNILSNSLSIFIETYRKLYDISISLDTSVFSETSAKLSVNEVYSSFTTVYSNFQTIFSNNEDKNFQEVSSCLSKTNQTLINLSSANTVSTGQTYSSLIKYKYMEILDNYYNLCENLNNL